MSLGDWAGAIRCERTTLLLDGDDGARSRPTPPGPPPLALAWSAIVGSYDHVSDVQKYGGSAAARGECQEGKRQAASGKRQEEKQINSFRVLAVKKRAVGGKIGPRWDRNRKEGKTREIGRKKKRKEKGMDAEVLRRAWSLRLRTFKKDCCRCEEEPQLWGWPML